MISFKNRVEEAYDQVSPFKLVFTNKKWNSWERPLYIVWIVLMAVVALLLNLTDSPPWTVPAALIVWVCLTLLGFYTFTNRHAKKRLVVLGIKPTKGFFKHWANDAYHEYKLKNYYKKLCQMKILSATSADVGLTEKCQNLFDNESKGSVKKGEFVFGSVILAIVIPAWDHYLEALYKAGEKHIGQVVNFTGAVILLVFCLLVIVACFRWMISDYINRRSNKYKDIARHLEIIHLNLKARYAE
ncbi:MAG: hypothetical protein ACOYXT_28820 [Bacteroidota bacterium]